MELSYWESRWRKNKTGFHMPEGYPGLAKYWEKLEPESISNVLVPLCGKSVDLIWLSERTDCVIGVEISEKAIREFMTENKRTWTESVSGPFRVFQSGNIQLWQGNFMKLPRSQMPGFDLIYDKAALIALPPQMRKRYANKILEFSGIRYLLHLFVYNQEEMNGPPFSVSLAEAEQYFSGKYQVSILDSAVIEPGQFPKFQKRGLKSPINEYLLYLKKISGK